MKYLLIMLAIVGCGRCDSKPTALVIGDSISLGWTPYLAIKTSDSYNWKRLTGSQVSTWPENARNTNYTLRNVNVWLDTHQPSIVIWNNGVWNCTPMGYSTPGEDPRNYGTSAAQYENELVQIARILRSRTQRVIFNTTTTCKGNGPEADHNAEVFNEIAKRVLPPLGIEIFDLYVLTKDHDGQNGHDQWWLNESDVHFNTFGNEYISEELKKLLTFK